LPFGEAGIRLESGYAPVFHDAPSASGSLRSLPGNIIVYLNPDWNQDTIGQWVKRHGYLVVGQLAVGPNVFVLETKAGLESLQLANELYESGEVVAAFPDWWLETSVR
jgi:hypothetical protein